MGRGCGALLSAVVGAAIAVSPAARIARAQEAPEVEPPDASGMEATCAEGADALWRGRIGEAERLARTALDREGGAGASAHARARCHALLGRAILAADPRDPEAIERAAEALRRAWALEPARDLVDELVATHWLGAATVLPIPARGVARPSPIERAAMQVAREAPSSVRTLRSIRAPRGVRWAIVSLESPRAIEIVAVGCARASCAGERLFALARPSEIARLASVGLVPTRRGLALVVDADHAIELAPRVLDPAGGGAIASWRGSAVYVRWIDEGGALGGWNVLTRSRARRWDREALGAGRPAAIDVRVRWAARRRVVLRRLSIRGASESAERALAEVLGLRDPIALGCGGCWLAGQGVPALAASATP